MSGIVSGIVSCENQIQQFFLNQKIGNWIDSFKHVRKLS
jgi:hypothetical protein